MGAAILAASGEISPGLILAGLGLLMLLFLIPRIGARRPRAGSPPTLSREREQEVRRTLEEVFVQLQEFTREALAKLDTRIRMLNQLIIDADERIRKLQAMPPAGGVPACGPAPAPVAAAPAPTTIPPPPPPNPLHERIWKLLDGGASVADVSRQVGISKGEVELIAGLRSIPQGP